MALVYGWVPSPKQFQKDTSITFAIRSHDRILKHIDWLLERYEARSRNVTQYEHSKRLVILCDLFFTCKFWIKSFVEKRPAMKAERHAAVHALFGATVRQLADWLKCPSADVGKKIHDIYGRSLSIDGVNVDEVEQSAAYYTEAERQVYRLWFRGGVAYQYQWWVNPLPVMTRVPADSRHACGEIIHRPGAGDSLPDFGGFVMTEDREVFMSKHEVAPEGGVGIFHSAYTRGNPVVMAGTMLIKAGVIKAIRSDSGHYHPTQQNMAALLQGLSMYGVNLRRVAVMDYDTKPLGNAVDFLTSRMTWAKFTEQQKKEAWDRMMSDGQRVTKNLPPKHPGGAPVAAAATAPSHGMHAPAYSSSHSDSGGGYNTDGGGYN
jgi:hypothetical protein